MTAVDTPTFRDSLAGTPKLLMLAMRTERIATPVGVLVVPILLLVTAASLAPLYPDEASRAALASGSAANPVFRILLGPLRDTSGIGSIALWRVGMFALLITAIIVAATVTRNLRAPEQRGRTELVRAGAIGPSAPLAAATIVAMIAAVSSGVLTGIASAIVGLPGPSALLAGVQFAGAGLAAAGIAVVVDQIVTTSRASLAASSAILLTAYVVRGVGDAVDSLSWSTWLSPLGWAERIDPSGSQSVLPVGGCVLLFVVGVVAAATISQRRDVGAGLVRPRPGSPAARWPISMTAVTVRTMGGSLAPWMSGAFGYCLLVGLLTNSVDDLVGGSGRTSDLIGKIGGGSLDIVAALTNTVLGVVAIAAAAAAVSVVGSLRDDDKSGRSEILLSTSVSPRARLLAAAATGFGAAALVLLLAAAGLVIGATVVGGSGPTTGDIMMCALSQVPPTLAVGAVAFAAYGVAPRWAALGWAAVVIDLLLGPFGTLIGAPQWLRDIAPHSHVPALVSAPIPAVPTVIALMVGAVLLGVGLRGVSRRDAV